MSLLTVAGRYYGIPIDLITLRIFYTVRSLLQGDAK
jgi:hypothetical protein